jgi:SLOG in TRPM, prokaryote
MRTKTIKFSNGEARCVLPEKMDDLGAAISALGLQTNYPVLVLIGGNIHDEHAKATRRAVEAVAKAAEELGALIICGGTAMGVMALIGEVRAQHSYQFPLVGIAPETMVTWPGRPGSFRFLWWGNERFDLAEGYSHFMLVPGREFGDESPWITKAARYFSMRNQSITVLMNGGNIARLDIELSLKDDRPVIAVAGTGRLADELAESKLPLVKAVSANEDEIVRSIRGFLSNS